MMMRTIMTMITGSNNSIVAIEIGKNCRHTHTSLAEIAGVPARNCWVGSLTIGSDSVQGRGGILSWNVLISTKVNYEKNTTIFHGFLTREILIVFFLQ